MDFGRKANKDWQTKLSTFWCSLALKTKTSTSPYTLFPPPSKECTQCCCSFIYIAESNHTWHFTYAQFRACSSKEHPAIQAAQISYPFPTFWELNYKVLLLLSAIISNLLPQYKSISIYWTFNEWCLFLTVIKKEHLIVSPTRMKHSYCICPAGPIFPAQFCSQSRTKYIKQAVWSSPELDNKGQEERYSKTHANNTINFYCINFFFPIAQMEHFLTRSLKIITKSTNTDWSPSWQFFSCYLISGQWTSRGRPRPSVSSAELQDGTASLPSYFNTKRSSSIFFSTSQIHIRFHTRTNYLHEV